ncbi:MAG: membrane protein insertase YidC [Methylophilaceae bacterium]
MDTKRLVLFIVFSMSILMLWDVWQRQHAPAPVAQQGEQKSSTSNSSSPSLNAPAVLDSDFKLAQGQRVNVVTDLYNVDIDTTGGDLRKLVLLKHRANNSDKANFILLDDAAKPMVYVAQTGLVGADLPNHKAIFTSALTSYKMPANKDTLEVRLSWAGKSGISVDKVYTFHRNQYLIDVNYEIKNGSNVAIIPTVYYQIVHDKESNQGSKLQPTFTGGTYFTQVTQFKKLAFKDMNKEPLDVKTNDGWVGILQHYFVSVWIQKSGISREFYTEKLNNDIYRIGSKSTLASIAPGASAIVPAQFYSGPQNKQQLEAAAPGLDLTVDYGVLKILAAPLFWVLSKINSLVNNWGVAIILLTLMIKAAFYPLSAKSYRSMAQMRELAPRLESMKQKFGDDRKKMQQAMMELYKSEKINPMSGCLPILIQIPVFISLYWMLLGSVELRHAPFFGWITDLSAPDTLFGTIPSSIPLIGGTPIGLLPIIMGLSMIIQTRLNPKPADPVQAKVMTWMPVIFSIFFFFFPAGLVLYWVVNNVISIWQQWFINKSIHAEALLKKKVVKN